MGIQTKPQFAWRVRSTVSIAVPVSSTHPHTQFYTIGMSAVYSLLRADFMDNSPASPRHQGC